MPPRGDSPQRRPWGLVLFLLVGWYLLGTLPSLDRYPRLESAQMGIVAPAHKLATEGVYGNELYAGFYRMEAYNYEYMPLYPLLVALSFKGFGLGIWQARMVSVLCGLVVIVLTFLLGRRLYDDATGLLAVFVLCVVRLAVDTWLYHSGILLLDLARVIRYDVLVPVWVLAACLLFLRSHQNKSRLGYVGTGVLAGLATLSHLYGGFILAVFGSVMLWQHGWRTLRSAPLYLIMAGWVLALIPWLVYILQDIAAYQGQMLRHPGRFDVFNPLFYGKNLIREVYRYTPWVGPSLRAPVVWPRLGIWVVVVGIPGAMVVLWKRARRQQRVADQMLLVALPLLALLLAMLVSFKRYAYLALLLPFLALLLAFVFVHLWRGVGRRKRSVRYALVLLLMGLTLEGGLSLAKNAQQARQATPYQRFTDALRPVIPTEARVLLDQTYWMALEENQTRSIMLTFLLSDPQYYRLATRPMREVIADIDPDYIVVGKYALEDYVHDPRTAANPWARAKWAQFGDYVRQACPSIVTTVSTPEYGEVRLYRCQ